VALPAFARCTPLLLSAGRAAIDRYMLPAGRRAYSSKRAAAGFAAGAHASTD